MSWTFMYETVFLELLLCAGLGGGGGGGGGERARGMVLTFWARGGGGSGVAVGEENSYSGIGDSLDEGTQMPPREGWGL